MSNVVIDLLNRAECGIVGHNYNTIHAINRTEDGYYRIHADGSRELIPSCEVVEECQRCGRTRRFATSVDMVERHEILKAWANDTKQ